MNQVWAGIVSRALFVAAGDGLIVKACRLGDFSS